MSESVASKQRPTVFIVDDDEAVRESLVFLMQTVGHTAETYASAQEFLDQYDANRPGCLLLDIRMTGMSGLELQEKLNEMHCILPIIFITGHGDVPVAVKAIQAGAADFIQKPFNDQELLSRIEEVLREEADNRDELLERNAILKNIDSLTTRESQVMEQVVDGKANKMIAYNLNVSQRTVEIHRANVMDKMQAKSLAHLVRLVMKARGEVT